MDRLTDTALAAAPANLNRPAVLADGRTWTWGEVHAAAIELAARFESAATVCNLCHSRLAFLVTWLAALRRGCRQVLPPSSGQSELSAMLESSAGVIVVVDDPESERQWATQWRCIRYAPPSIAADRAIGALPWVPNWDAPAVTLYTSGSTGTPQAHTKTLGQLARGAQVLAARLKHELADEWAALSQIVCSVPPQHMFGLETSVMLPLVTGLPVREGRPLLPADVEAAFARAGAAAAWVATPLHVRGLARSGIRLRHCRLALVSTMPIDAALATEAERLTGAPLQEIYGSTETGVLAMRRTARERDWRPVEGVSVEPLEDGAQVSGTHFSSPQRLADQIERNDDASFSLRGRQGDLIKIAGRRASLASLNLAVQDLPGLTDGVLYLPATGSDTERTILIHAGPPLDQAAARQWLRERMDPVFVPRVFIRVERLPRSGAGKVSRAALDAIYAAHRDKRTARMMRYEFEWSVAPDHPSLPGHFPGQPLVPGVLLLDRALQVLESSTGQRCIHLQQVKFISALPPGERAAGCWEVEGASAALRITARRESVLIKVVEGLAMLSREEQA
jgi:acyl-coenzyme A synthetase/AMP-(fatty) acid ligase/3-hydroxymyristoyl/3-hydroxydecanoyl-(acyl carrier protein) dehydratase